MANTKDRRVGYIAENVKEYRLRCGLTQVDFAKLLEMDYYNYGKMEKGLYSPSLRKLVDICRRLGITPDELLLKADGKGQNRAEGENLCDRSCGEKMEDVKYEIIKRFGVLSVNASGYRKEFNLISWNGKEPKYDIRSFSPDCKWCGRGVTLTEQEAILLLRALQEEHLIDQGSDGA